METNFIGKRIYYNPSNGTIIYNTGDRSGTGITKSTVEEDFRYVLELQDYSITDLKYIEFEFGEYEEDIANCNNFRINPETLQLEFTYRENETNYTKPLSIQFEELKAENITMQETIATLQKEQSLLRTELENLRSQNLEQK